MADLLRYGAGQAADYEMRSGEIAANLAQNIAGIAGNTLNSYAEHKAGEPRRQAEAEALAAAKEERARQTSIKDAARLTPPGADGRPNLQQIAEEVSRIDPMAALEFFNAADEQTKAKLLHEKQKTEELARMLGGFEMGVRKLPPPERQAEWTRLRGAAVESGLVPAESVPEQYSPAFVSQAMAAVMPLAEVFKAIQPQDPKMLNVPSGGAVYDPESRQTVFQNRPEPKPEPAPNNIEEAILRETDPAKRQELIRLKERLTAAGRAPAAAEPLVPVFDAEQNAAVYRPRSQAVGQRVPSSTTAKETTEDERKSVGFHGQMSEAIKIIDATEAQLSDKDIYQLSLPQEQMLGLLNRGEMSEPAKRYLRAFNQFTEARLRSVSGAAIAESEYARDRQTYGKQYGETPTLAQERKAARVSAVNTLKTRAGRAYQDEGLTVTTPDGQTFQFKSKAEADGFKKRAGIKD